jgi:hypothetical protein
MLSLLPSLSLSPAAEASIVRIVEAIEAPAFLLLWIIARYQPDRFATGLTDPPTRMTLLGLSSIGYLNGLVWLIAALGSIGLSLVPGPAEGRDDDGGFCHRAGTYSLSMGL